jgi:hypothetical protein
VRRRRNSLIASGLKHFTRIGGNGNSLPVKTDWSRHFADLAMRETAIVANPFSATGENKQRLEKPEFCFGILSWFVF